MSKTDNEKFLELKKILVENNEKVIGVRIAHGYMGVGGSNRSGFQQSHCYEYTAQQLDGMEPFRVMNSEICALANDMLYLRHQGDDGMRVYTIDYPGCIMTGDSVAYDTVTAVRIRLLLAESE